MRKKKEKLNQIKCFKGENNMRYLIWINDLVVIENNEEYDFLDEMYPEIKDKYIIMWAIKNAAKKPINDNIRNKIDKIQKEIETKLEMLGIDNYILFIKRDNKFIEPVSGVEFDISKKSLHLREASEEEEQRYINGLTKKNIEFLNNKMPYFKNSINSYQKRK